MCQFKGDIILQGISMSLHTEVYGDMKLDVSR